MTVTIEMVDSEAAMGGGNPWKDICWKFNMGKCTFGLSCKFDHKCALCLKFGHGAHNCRRANTDVAEHRGRDHHGDKGGYTPRNDRFHFVKNGTGCADQIKDKNKDRK